MQTHYAQELEQGERMKRIMKFVRAKARITPLFYIPGLKARVRYEFHLDY